MTALKEKKDGFTLDMSRIVFEPKRHRGRGASKNEPYINVSVYKAGDIAVGLSKEAMLEAGWRIHDQIRMGLQDDHLVLIRVPEGGWLITPKSKGTKQHPELIGAVRSGIVRRPLLPGLVPFDYTEIKKYQVIKYVGAICFPLPKNAFQLEAA